MYAKLIKQKKNFFYKTLKLFSTNNEPEIILDTPNENKIIEEIIDIKAQKNENDKFKIDDVYNIKSKKLGPPNIANFIDKTRIVNPNVTFSDTFIKEEFNKDDFEEMNPIPISPKLGPFEVK